MLSILALNNAIKAGKSASETAPIDSPKSPEIKFTEAPANPPPGDSKSVSDVAQSRPFRATPGSANESAKEAARGEALEAIKDAPQETGRKSAGTSSSDVPQARAAVGFASADEEESGNDYEIVLGRRQIASCLFAGVVLLAIFASASYFAGKMSTPSCTAASSLPPAVAPGLSSSVNPSVSSSPTPAPLPHHESALMVQGAVQQASPAPAGVARPETAAKPNAFPFVATGTEGGTATAQTPNAPEDLSAGAGMNATLFATPRAGALYLQIGALDRNTAAIVVAGLREHGYRSFVAPGPSEKIFRVLVGPFAGPDEYKRIKAEMDAMNVTDIAHETLGRHAQARSN